MNSVCERFLGSVRRECVDHLKPTLGTFGAMTVEQGRELARDMLARVCAGDDPSLARRTAREWTSPFSS
jgi:hypothetical protein